MLTCDFVCSVKGSDRGSGAHVKACISGLKGRLFSPPLCSSPGESRRGLFAVDSVEEELESRLGVEDFLREAPTLLGGAEPPLLLVSQLIT